MEFFFPKWDYKLQPLALHVFKDPEIMSVVVKKTSKTEGTL